MNNEVNDFMRLHGACAEGFRWALTQPNMEAVFDNCERGDWLMWVLIKHNVLDKITSVKLACEFALRVLPIYEKRYSRKEPRLAIEAALEWVKLPTEENRLRCRYAAAAAYAAAVAAAAAAAADAAAAAAAAADAAAADAAAAAADAATDAAAAADAAAYAYAYAAAVVAAVAYADAAADAAVAYADAARNLERLEQCKIIRQIVKNPWRDAGGGR